jgi:hypothetical protein
MTFKHRRLIKSLALALVTAAVAAPAASARVNLNPPFSQPTSATQVVSSPPETVTVVKSSGFDWGDAGIGAGAVVVVVLAGIGARLTVGHRRQIHSSAARSSISAA